MNASPAIQKGAVVALSTLHAVVYDRKDIIPLDDGSFIIKDGAKPKKDYGIVSRRVVTTAGVNAIRDGFLGTFTLSNFKYHAMGTNNTAEASGDTALGTEVETRTAGTQVSGGTGAYQTVGTITATATRAITEHGLLSASSAGTLLDRSVFSTINLASGDGIQFTYTITFTAGG